MTLWFVINFLLAGIFWFAERRILLLRWRCASVEGNEDSKLTLKQFCMIFKYHVPSGKPVVCRFL